MTSSHLMNCFAATKPCICAHVYCLKHHRDDYVKQLRHYRHNPTMWDFLSHAIKARIFAALHLCKEHKEVEDIVAQLDITDIEKACCNILDRPRQARQLQKKIESYERQNPHILQAEEKKSDTNSDENSDKGDSQAKLRSKQSKSLRTILKLRRMLRELQDSLEWGEAGGKQHCPANEPCALAHQDSAVKELIQSSSVSGSLAEKIRKRFKSQKPDFLEFVMLTMPTKSWKNVADLVHFRPQDFTVPYFLAHVFGEALPEDSFVFSMKQLSKVASDDGNDTLITVFRDIAQRFPQVYDGYAYVRTLPSVLRSKDVVEDLARNIPLDQVIWYFEELHGTSKACGTILEDRLRDDGILSSTTIITSPCKVYTYGKLLERILTFQKKRRNDKVTDLLIQMATIRLKHMKEQASSSNLHAKTVVFGDASSSMQSAIEAATILAVMVSVCMKGHLSFFASGLIESPHIKPSSVEETLDICTKVRANGCTSLAAALWPYYEAKEHVDTIIMVTDEEENTNCNGYDFAELLRKYKTEVNPRVALTIVCVGTGDLKFRKSLETNGIVWKTFSIDGHRPDLTKLDALLGEIAIMSNKILVRTDQVENAVEDLENAESGGVDDFILVD